MSGLRYLIIDDEELIREFIGYVFINEAAISYAGNGEEALELLLTNQFNVIICDVQMPFINGIDLYTSLKNNNSTICEKFVFCTGNITDDFLQFCQKNKVPYCEKPIKFETLKSIVHQVTKKQS